MKDFATMNAEEGKRLGKGVDMLNAVVFGLRDYLPVLKNVSSVNLRTKVTASSTCIYVFENSILEDWELEKYANEETEQSYQIDIEYIDGTVKSVPVFFSEDFTPLEMVWKFLLILDAEVEPKNTGDD